MTITPVTDRLFWLTLLGLAGWILLLPSGVVLLLNRVPFNKGIGENWYWLVFSHAIVGWALWLPLIRFWLNLRARTVAKRLLLGITLTSAAALGNFIASHLFLLVVGFLSWAYPR